MTVPSDAERTEVADQLRRAVVSGLLPFDQLEGRLDAAYAAGSIEDLERLVRWLPQPVASSRARWRSWWWRGAAAGVAAIAMIVGFAATRPDSSPPRQSLNRPAEITPNQDSAQAPSNDVAPTRLFGWAAGTDSAIIAIDVSAGRATIETRLRDVTYPTCASFHAVSSAGDEIGIGGLLPGDFARVDIDAGAGCLERVALLEPTVPPACDSSEAPGSGVVTWKGFNPRAHSVLYLPSGSTQSVLATRWCESPTVVGADGSATTLARIPLGAQVELLTSSGWVTSITVKS